MLPRKGDIRCLHHRILLTGTHHHRQVLPRRWTSLSHLLGRPQNQWRSLQWYVHLWHRLQNQWRGGSLW